MKKISKIILSIVVICSALFATNTIFAKEDSNYTVDFTYNNQTIAIDGNVKNYSLDQIFSSFSINDEIVNLQVYTKDMKTLFEDNVVYNAKDELLFSIDFDDNVWLFNSYNSFDDEFVLVCKSNTTEYVILITDPRTDPIDEQPSEDNDYSVVAADFVEAPLSYQWYKMVGFKSLTNLEVDEDYSVSIGSQTNNSIVASYDEYDSNYQLLIHVYNQPYCFSFDYEGELQFDGNSSVVSYKDNHYVVYCPNDGYCTILNDNDFSITNVKVAYGTAIEGETKNSIGLKANKLEDTFYYCYLFSKGEHVDTSSAIRPSKISFVGDDETSGEISDIYQFASRKITLPSSGLKKIGYYLTGWDDGNTDYDIDDEYSALQEDVVLTATFEELSAYSEDIMFSITPLEYGLKKDDITVEVDDDDLEVKSFELWYYDDSDGQTKVVSEVEKTGIYSFYIIVQSKKGDCYFLDTEVHGADFYSGGISLEDDSPYGSYLMEAIGVETCDITKTGFEFYGSSYTYKANVVLGAKITAELPGNSVIYDDNDTSAELSVPEDNNTYLENSSFEITKEVPTRKGYVFVGWNIDKNATVGMNFTDNKYTMGSEDITFYAIWKKVIIDEPTKNNDYQVKVDSSLANVTYQWYKLVKSYVDIKDSTHVTDWVSTYNQEDNTYSSIVSLNVPKISFKPKDGVDITKVYIQYTFQNEDYIIQGKQDYSKGNPGIGVANLNGDLSNFTISNVKEILTIGVKVDGQTKNKLGLETLENASYYCDVLINGKVVATSEEIKPQEISFKDKTGTMLVLPDNIYQLDGRKITFPTTTYTKPGYKLTGWNSKEDNTGTTYNVGGKYKVGNKNEIFYAKWDEKANISINEVANDDVTYDGQGHAYTISGTNATLKNYVIKYALHKDSHEDADWSDATPINVGTYDVKISRAEDSDYKSYSKEISKAITINKAQVELPTAVTNLIYDGSEQFGISILLGAPYTLSNNTAINAGDYIATVSLNDKDNYEWKIATPSSDDQEIDYSIAKKEVTVTAQDKSMNLGDSVPTFTAKEEGVIEGDELTYTFNTINPTVQGVYSIVPTGDVSQGNYIVTYKQGTLTVNELDNGAKADSKDVAKVLKKYRKDNNYTNKTLDVEVRTSSNVSNTDKKLIKDNMSSNSKVIFMDAKLYLIINDGLNTTEKDIGDENDQLIAITYKFDFNNKTDIHVLRVHNGEVKEITTTPDKETGEYITLNKEEGTITVYAKKYSTFAFTYKQVDTKPYEVVNTGVNGNDNTLKLISLLSLLGIATIITTKKKKY